MHVFLREITTSQITYLKANFALPCDRVSVVTHRILHKSNQSFDLYENSQAIIYFFSYSKKPYSTDLYAYFSVFIVSLSKYHMYNIITSNIPIT